MTTACPGPPSLSTTPAAASGVTFSPLTTTRATSAVNSRAAASPRPRVPPVTTYTRSFKPRSISAPDQQWPTRPQDQAAPRSCLGRWLTAQRASRGAVPAHNVPDGRAPSLVRCRAPGRWWPWGGWLRTIVPPGEDRGGGGHGGWREPDGVQQPVAAQERYLVEPGGVSHSARPRRGPAASRRQAGRDGDGVA